MTPECRDVTLLAAPSRTAFAVLKEQPFALVAACCAGLAGFLTGWDVGYIGSLIESASFVKDLNDGELLSGFEAGLLVGLQPAGMAFTSLPCVGGLAMDRLGRRGLLILCGILTATAGILQATANGLHQFCFGRALLGLSVGFSFVCPVYQGEVAPKEARGAIMSTFPLLLTFGIFAASACNYGVQNVEHGWRLVLWPMVVFGGGLAVGMVLCPESPRHLLAAGREDDSKQVLMQLRRGASSEYIALEWEVIQQDVQVELCADAVSYSAMLSGFMGRLLAVGILGWMLFQLCGMPVFSYYGPRIFKIVGIDAFGFQMVTTGFSLLATIPTVWIIDQFGRKRLLKSGAVCMGICMIGLGLAGTLGIVVPEHCHTSGDRYSCAHSPGSPYGEVSWTVQAAFVTLSIGFCVAYSISWGAVMNVFGNEIFPLKFRSRAAALGSFTAAAGNFCMGQFVPLLIDAMGFGTFFLFGLFDAFCFLYACWIPETANVHLEHLVEVFENRFGVSYDVNT